MFILFCVVTGIVTAWLSGRTTKGTEDGAVMHMASGFGSVLAAATLLRLAAFVNRFGIYCGPGVAAASAGAGVMTFTAACIADNRHYATAIFATEKVFCFEGRN